MTAKCKAAKVKGRLEVWQRKTWHFNVELGFFLGIRGSQFASRNEAVDAARSWAKRLGIELVED